MIRRGHLLLWPASLAGRRSPSAPAIFLLPRIVERPLPWMRGQRLSLDLRVVVALTMHGQAVAYQVNDLPLPAHRKPFPAPPAQPVFVDNGRLRPHCIRY